MKTILILGAGFGQVPAIKKAKKLGMRVVCIDKNPKAQGMRLADYAYDIDIIDFNGALEIAKKHQVNGVMTMQSDIAVPTMGYINDQLKLNGVSLDVANACSNKTETRKRLAKLNCAQPLFEIVENLKDTVDSVGKIGYPCIIKAPDSSGSRGVVKVNSSKEVKSAFEEAKKYSRIGLVLVEEFIEGLEFGAQTFSVDGECVCVLLHGDTMSAPPFMIPIGHSLPFTMLNEQDKKNAIEDIKNAIDTLGIKNGPANVDLILDKKTNRVKIIEIGARIGATCLPELVHYHTGIDWIKQTILNAIGETVNLKLTSVKPVAALIVQAPKNGVYRGYEIQDKKYLEVLLEFEITCEIGEYVSELRKGTDRIGKVLAYGKNVNDAEKKVMDLTKKIKFKID